MRFHNISFKFSLPFRFLTLSFRRKEKIAWAIWLSGALTHELIYRLSLIFVRFNF